MSDVTDPREPHPDPALPDEAPAQIPPEVAEAVSHGEATRATSPSYATQPPIQPQARGRSGTRVLIALGFLLLFGAVGYEYVRGEALATRLDDVERAQAGTQSASDVLMRSVQAETEARSVMRHDIEALQNAKSPAATSAFPEDLGPVGARLADLERKVAALGAASTPSSGGPAPVTAASGPAPTSPSVDLGSIETRLTDLEHKISAAPAAVSGTAPAAAPTDLGPVEARLKALEDKPAPAPAPAPDVALLARVNGIADQLDGLGKKLADAQAQAATAQTSAQAAQSRATVALTRAAATVALDDGKPLGTIAHATPALTRFATEAPPTEAALRLSYDDAAQKAQNASVPPTAGKKFGARMLTRIESLVTVSQGDHVLVGPPAATILAAAHEKLQAGDLAGAVAALDGLDPAAKAAMAPWVDRATSLLDARAALQSDQLGAP